jgi:hypothetical protein
MVSMMAGCASTKPAPTTSIPFSDVPLVVDNDPGWVRTSVPAAMARLRAAGLDIQQATTIEVHADVDSFVKRTGVTNANLRAWSTAQRIDLIDRWAWRNADDEHTIARLTHELCHAAVYQRLHALQVKADVPDSTPPRTLQEGLCSWVARQGPDRMPWPDVVAWHREHSNVDVFADAAFDQHTDVAYGAAHHLVTTYAVSMGNPKQWMPVLLQALATQQLPPELESARQGMLAELKAPAAPISPSG